MVQLRNTILFLACNFLFLWWSCSQPDASAERPETSDASVTIETRPPDATIPPETPSPEISTKREEADQQETSSSSESATPEQGVPELPPTPMPKKPAGLVSYVTGNPEDAKVQPKGPGLILMGGSREVDAAFHWWKPQISQGDVVIIRSSGSDGYNSYLYKEIGGAHSVVTLLVTSRELANSDYVAWHLERAEGVFLAGGDQSKYVKYWKDTRLVKALQTAWSRGAVIGGTSAGLAVLGAFLFSANKGTVTSQQALANPYTERVQLARKFLSFSPLQHVITDSHFAERDRMGRLVTFLARLIQDGWTQQPIGIGVDERTALVIDAKGKGRVMGRGAVYLVKSPKPPKVCAPGKALDWSGITYSRLIKGDTVSLPSGTTSQQSKTLSINKGQMAPASPHSP